MRKKIIIGFFIIAIPLAIAWYKGDEPKIIAMNFVQNYMSYQGGLLIESTLSGTTEERQLEIAYELELVSANTSSERRKELAQYVRPSDNLFVGLIDRYYGIERTGSGFVINTGHSDGTGVVYVDVTPVIHQSIMFNLLYYLPRGWTATYDSHEDASPRWETITLENDGYILSLYIVAKGVEENGAASMLDSLDLERLEITDGLGKGSAFLRSKVPYSLEGIGPGVGNVPVYMDTFVMDKVFDTPKVVGPSTYVASAKSQMETPNFYITVSYILPVTVSDFEQGNYNHQLLDMMDKIVGSLSW